MLEWTTIGKLYLFLCLDYGRLSRGYLFSPQRCKSIGIELRVGQRGLFFLFFFFLPHFVLTIRIWTKQPITLSHKPVLSLCSGKSVWNVSSLSSLQALALAWQTSDIFTWATVFFSSSPKQARTACTAIQGNIHSRADYRERPKVLSSLWFQYSSSYGTQSIGPHLPHFPHTTCLQHLQVSLSWWRPQDCSLEIGGLNYSFQDQCQEVHCESQLLIF